MVGFSLEVKISQRETLLQFIKHSSALGIFFLSQNRSNFSNGSGVSTEPVNEVLHPIGNI